MTRKWTAADLPDQSGKTFVVTGATAGLGEVATRELAHAGARVVMAVRNVEKATAMVKEIGPTRGEMEIRHLDVASLKSIDTFVEGSTEPIDVLVNNAGISLVPLTRTDDGLELQMATNYFGAAVLSSALLPRITDRIVSVSSQLHRVSRLRLDDLNWESRHYDQVAAYCDSKLALVLFANELQRRLAATGRQVRSITAHPGIARTSLVSHSSSIFGRVNALGPLLNDAARGALPTLFASTMDVPGGSYVGPDGIASIKGYPTTRTSSRTARDPDLALDLWRKTSDILGSRFVFAA